MLAAEDWGQKHLSGVSDLSDDLSLFSDENSDSLDLLGDDNDLLLQDSNLFDVFILLGDVSGLVDDNSDLSDLSSDLSDVVDVFLDDNKFLSNDNSDLLDLDLLFIGVDADVSLLDNVDLLSDIDDSDSDLVDLDSQSLQDRSVFLNLLDEFLLLFWDSDDLSLDSSDSSLDDNSLGNEFVNSDGELVDDRSELDEFFLDWFWSQAVSVWSLEGAALLGDGIALSSAFASLGEEEVAFTLDGSEFVLSFSISWVLVAGSFDFSSLSLEVLEFVVDALAFSLAGLDLDSALFNSSDFFWGLDTCLDWFNTLGNGRIDLGDLGDVNLDNLSVFSNNSNQFLDFDVNDLDLVNDNLLFVDVSNLGEFNSESLQGLSDNGQFSDNDGDLLEGFLYNLLVFDNLVLDFLWMDAGVIAGSQKSSLFDANVEFISLLLSLQFLAFSPLGLESLDSFFGLFAGESWLSNDLNKFSEVVDSSADSGDLLVNNNLLLSDDVDDLLELLDFSDDGDFSLLELNDLLVDVLRLSDQDLDVLLSNWLWNWGNQNSDSSLDVGNFLN